MKNFGFFVLPLVVVAAALAFVLFLHLNSLAAQSPAKPLAASGMTDAEFAELIN